MFLIKTYDKLLRCKSDMAQNLEFYPNFVLFKYILYIYLSLR